MPIISFKVPLWLKEELDDLVRSGVFVSKSEILREALFRFLTEYRREMMLGRTSGGAVGEVS